MAQDLSDVERDRRALEIFAQACGLAASDRARLLAELCGDDSTVRRRVEAMLAADGGGDTPVGSDDDVDRFVARQIGGITLGDDSGMSTAAGAVDGEYTLLRVIGEGGMGTVYEAEQHHPRRRVAIKAIRPGRITPQMSKRFEYEAQVLARLEHPGIARLYESNAQSEGGHVRAYLAMELVDGVPIDTYCAANGLSHVERLRLFMRVCEAVSYAHRMGVIHRDLKPANILVAADGQPKILDFGVARTVEGARADVTMLTEHGQIVGTLAYMSPEQVEGRADVDTRADVYSLGVILYRLLAGVLPIDVGCDSIVEATRRILAETPARIGRHDRRLKGDLEVVVCQSLEKDPARRYASVDQLREELDRYLGGRPIEARADSTLYVMRKAVWRHRGPVGAGLLLVALVAAFGVVASIQAGRNRRLADAAVASEVRATQRAEDLARLLYFSNIGFAQSAMANNDMERAYTLLDGCDEALREWEWFHLQRLRDLSSATVDLPLTRPRYASYSRDRSRMALASLDREVVMVDPSAGDREVLRDRVPEGTARAALSPDGRWLAFGGAVDQVVLVELATNTRRTLPVDVPKPRDLRRTGLRLLQFTPDSRTLVTGGTDQTLRVWDVSGAAAAPQPPRTTIALGEPQQPICLLISHDCAWAAVGDSRGGLRLFDLHAGTLLRRLAGHDVPVWSLALSRDGKRLASGDNNARVIVWDPATGERLHRADTSDGWITALCFSPDASRLAVGRADSNVRLIDFGDDAASVTGAVLRGHRHAIVHIDWRDGNTLHTVSLDGTLKTWDADSALQVPTIVTGQPESVGLAFDATGDHVYVGGSDGSVRSWKVTAEDALHPVEARRLADHKLNVLEVVVDPLSGRVCTAGRDGVIRITGRRERDPATMTPLVIAPGTGPVSAVDFSPDGRTLVVGTDGELSLWDAYTGRRLRDLTTTGVVTNELRFARDGVHFYGACVDGHLRRWSVDSPKALAEALVDPHGLYDVQLSPDGTRVLVCGDTQLVALLEADTLAEVKRYVGHQGVVLGVAFHPGGRRVASGGTDGTIRIWDVQTAKELIALRGHRRRIEHLSFSPDGSTLASSSDDGTVKLWRTTRGNRPR